MNKTITDRCIELIDERILKHQEKRESSYKNFDEHNAYWHETIIDELDRIKETLTDLKQEEEELIKESALSFNEWLVENCELSEDIWSYYGEDYSLDKLFEIFKNRNICG